MKTLTGKQRRYLASEAHHIEPVVMIGQKGLSDSLLKMVDQALNDHELIKCRFQDFKEAKKELSNQICEKTQSHIIRLIGNVLVLYRQQKDPEKRKIIVPE